VNVCGVTVAIPRGRAGRLTRGPTEDERGNRSVPHSPTGSGPSARSWRPPQRGTDHPGSLHRAAAAAGMGPRVPPSPRPAPGTWTSSVSSPRVASAEEGQGRRLPRAPGEGRLRGSPGSSPSAISAIALLDDDVTLLTAVDVVVFEDELRQPASKPTMQASAHAAAGRKTRRCRPHGGGIFNNGSRLVGARARTQRPRQHPR
jgi:hypothetical protein